MSSREAAISRGRAASQRHRQQVVAELHDTRVANGLSRHAVAQVSGLSVDRIGRLERGDLPDPGVDLIIRVASALGLEASIRFYPAGERARDVPQMRLLERLRARVAPSVPWQTEVPIAGRSDLRAWDVALRTIDCRDAVEGVTRLGDVQATVRQLLLKLRDDPTVGHLILLIADTRSNRRVLALAREQLRTDFPLDTREILAALGAGRCPGQNGIVVL